MLLSLLVLTSLLLAQASEDLDRALLAKAMPVDPDLVVGTLPNGMAYWIRPNATPPGKVSMMLHFASGSLNENENQRGVAHFLEHMAFNGSKHFPPGEMVAFFESLGMKFGQHTNAFTGLDQTSYIMHLSSTKKETLENVLLYLSDVGSALLLGEEEINKERGVILEEKRSRSGASERIRNKVTPIVAPGARLNDRMPIGLAEVIKSAPRERFVEYYSKWYRPNHATLIVCGDIKADELRPMIEKAFKDWKSSEEAVVQQNAGLKVHTDLRAGVVTDPEVPGVQIGLGAFVAKSTQGSVGDARRGLVRGMGGWIVNRRLRQMVQKGEAPFQSASVSRSVGVLKLVDSVDVDASGEPDKWAEMLTSVLIQAKRAKVHGFTDTEIELAKKTILSGAERGAKMAETMSSNGLVMALNGAVSAGRKPTSAAQRLELVRAFLPGITAAEVHKQFQDDFALKTGVVIATLPEKEGVVVPTAAEVLAVAKKALAAEVGKAATETKAKALLSAEPVAGKIKERTLDADTGIVSITYENGARVHFRSMDFRKDQVLVQIQFAGGGMDETTESKLYTTVGSMALQPRSAASSTHSATEISDLMTGKKVGFGGGPSNAGFGFNLSGSPEDLEDGFRLAYLLLTDPKLEDAAMTRWRQQMAMMLPNLKTNTGLQARVGVTEMLSGGDVRMSLPTLERVAAVERKAAEAWIKNVLANAPIEASFVGDMPVERMIELATRYIGALPARKLVREDEEATRTVKGGKGPMVRDVPVDTVTNRADVMQGWRGPSRLERQPRRVMLFASQILGTRLNKAIREERALTYSIGCAYSPGDYSGMGHLTIQFTADPEKAHEATKIAKQVSLELMGDKPPTDAEMSAVKEQIQNLLDTQLKQPRFWAQSLSSLRSSGRTIDGLKTLEKDYAVITKEEIVAALKKYLTEERYYQVVAAPKVAAETDAVPPEDK